MKSRGSIPKLRAALDDRSAVVSFAAAQALWSMGDHSGENIFEEVSEGDRKVSASMIQQGMQKAHEELHDPTALAELGAVQAAGAFLGPGGFGVEVALEMAKDSAAPARAMSVRLLGDDSSAQAHDYLQAALEDKSWLVRAAAAEALGTQGAMKDVELLRPLLKDPQKQVRYRAAAAIIRITKPGLLDSHR
jgi:HEAT repeat protein